MRRLGEGGRAGLEAFLGGRVETSMFPSSDLARHGMGRGHPRAMRFWGAGQPREAVLGVTGEGMALPQLAPAFAGAAAAPAGERVTGIIGESGQVAAPRGAMGLADAPVRMDKEEPLFALDLAGLRMPEVAGLPLGPLSEGPRGLMTRWRADYGREVLGSGEDADALALDDIEAGLAAGQHRVAVARQGAGGGHGLQRAACRDRAGGGRLGPSGAARPRLGAGRRGAAPRGGAGRGGRAGDPVLGDRGRGAGPPGAGFREIGRFALLVFRGAQAVPPLRVAGGAA